MIKAIFFDWSGTLARYLPRREELQSQALKELGYTVSPADVAPGLAVADRYLIREVATRSMGLRTPADQAKVYTHYQQLVFDKIGVNLPETSPDFPRFMMRLNELSLQLKFVLYDDVLPAFKALKERGLTLGLVTNVDADMHEVCKELGLADYLDFIVTSGEVKASKPHPRIFLKALEKAGVSNSEAAHVGDQPDIDVAGAKAAGIKPILIDRRNLFPNVRDCVVVRSLTEVINNLE